MCVTESDVGRCILKVLAGLCRFRKMGLDAWSCALCWAGQQRVTVRPAPGERSTERPTGLRATGQVPGSGNIWTYAAIKVHLHVFGNSFKRRMVFGKISDRFTGWEDLKRSMMLRLSEQVRWSLRLLLRPPRRRSIKRIYKTLPALRGVDNNIWWFNRDVALAL